MLSRLAFRAVQKNAAPSFFAIRTVSNTPASKSATATTSSDEGSERDTVNFPRRSFPVNPDPVRLGIFPEEWFTAFHHKTGVTGPYMLVASVTTFLLSKEFWVLEHDFTAGLGIAIIFIAGYQSFGKNYSDFINKEIDNEIEKLRSIKTFEIERCKDLIAEEEKAQWMATSYETLIEAKRESVALQLESAYRSRLQEVYEQVKKRLDYQVETNNVVRRIEQKHMVNWIVNNVRKSISAKQEDDALKKCISDLKALA